jgi:hypothetical protein
MGILIKIIFLLTLAFINKTVFADSFSLDGLTQKEVEQQKDDNSYFSDFLKKKISLEFGVMPSTTPWGDSKISGVAFLEYKDNWKDLSWFAKGGYTYSKYSVQITPLERYKDENLPDKELTIEYKTFGLNEGGVKYSPSEYIILSAARQTVSWGQIDGVSVISLFTLPANDNIVTFTPNKTDLLYPQDIISVSIFPNQNNEINLYYFVNPRLSPLFEDILGDVLLKDTPPVWAARYTYYGQQSIIAFTYFEGVSFWGGNNKSLKVYSLGNNLFYKDDNSNTFFSKLGEEYYEDGKDGPATNISMADTSAKSRAIAFEFSYNIDSKWSVKGDFVVDFTEKFLGAFISKDINNPSLIIDADEVEYLNFIAENGAHFTSTTAISNIQLLYKGTRWDTSIAIIIFGSTINLFEKNGKEYIRQNRYNNMDYGKKSIKALPLFNTAYSFNDDKTVTLGYFLGNQGGLFGTGIYFTQDVNSYVTWGAITGIYYGLSDAMDILRGFAEMPDKYEPKEANSSNLIQASLALRIKV